MKFYIKTFPDSVFIKNLRGTTSTDQYEKIVNILRRETRLPISIEHHFKFLVLLAYVVTFQY